jgi:hypothetical protein
MEKINCSTQRPILSVIEPTKTVARRLRARSEVKNQYSYDMFMLYVLTSSQRSTVDFVSLTPASVPFSNSIMSMLSGKKGFHKIIFFQGDFHLFF